MKSEKIVCACVCFDMGRGFETLLVLDYDDYRIINFESNDQNSAFIQSRENGFITSKNRFVDAKEAEWIALKAGQLKFKNGNVVPYVEPKDGIDILVIGDFFRKSGEYFLEKAPESIDTKEIGRGLKVEDLY